jgi:UDP-sulfoquinovose synthase
MRILVLGGDGYLGWPTAMHFSRRGDDVMVVDNFTRRAHHLERGTDSLMPISPLMDRIAAWRQLAGREILAEVMDICDYPRLRSLIERFARHDHPLRRDPPARRTR